MGHFVRSGTTEGTSLAKTGEWLDECFAMRYAEFEMSQNVFARSLGAQVLGTLSASAYRLSLPSDLGLVRPVEEVWWVPISLGGIPYRAAEGC